MTSVWALVGAVVLGAMMRGPGSAAACHTRPSAATARSLPVARDAAIRLRKPSLDDGKPSGRSSASPSLCTRQSYRARMTRSSSSGTGATATKSSLRRRCRADAYASSSLCGRLRRCRAAARAA
eukprot:4323966-Prymnesium_polylepis.1